ncbi:MAG: hypothetical protein ACKO6F_07515 [Cyanobium sp.]
MKIRSLSACIIKNLTIQKIMIVSTPAKLNWIQPCIDRLQAADIEKKNTNTFECGGPADDPNAPSCLTLGPS